MDTARRLYLFCYDIASTRRRRAVQKLLMSYRVEGQKSVFECAVTDAELRTLIDELETLIDPGADRIHVLRLDPRQQRVGWGRAAFHTGGPFLVA